MIDIVIPVPISNIALAAGAIEMAIPLITIPFKLFVMVDGGSRAAIQPVETHLLGHKYPWKMVHSGSQSKGYVACLDVAIREHCKEELVAVLGPELRIDDKGWIGKMQDIFAKDPVCGIVDTEPDTKSRTLPPWRREVTSPPGPGCRLFMVRRPFALQFLHKGDVDPVFGLARAALTNGRSSWCARSVGYKSVTHERHKLWCDNSEQKSHSESRSPTMQSSSTRTTTGKAGSKGFEV